MRDCDVLYGFLSVEQLPQGCLVLLVLTSAAVHENCRENEATSGANKLLCGLFPKQNGSQYTNREARIYLLEDEGGRGGKID